jgi:ApbE superfamily uncharacterized protein (UPF0280 family)
VDDSRTYRNLVSKGDLVAFTVEVGETDLYIRANRDLSKEALASVRELRSLLEAYIADHPRFKESLKPVAVAEDAPPIVLEMAAAATKAGVGPMAAVAGAIAERVGRKLTRFSENVVVENGGDVFLSIRKARRVMIYAGRSRLSNRVSIEVHPEKTPLGVCTSSGTVGHSLSFGRADAVTVLSRSTALADAAATAIANLVKTESDISPGLDLSQRIPGVEGVVIILGERMGLWGDVVLSRSPMGFRSPTDA